MANPTDLLLTFTDLATGHIHIRSNRILLPNIKADLTLLPATIYAETYIKANGQWLQIHLAGADPKSLEVEGDGDGSCGGGLLGSLLMLLLMMVALFRTLRPRPQISVIALFCPGVSVQR